MTVSSQSNKITYEGNGSSTDWDFTFSQDGDDANIQVFYTDADGNITELATNLYSVTLNPPSGTNPTGIGGTVTYPLTGSPIAISTFITIIRELPLTQGSSFSNQGTMYPKVVEARMDVLTMQIQQLNERLGRQFTVPVSDDDPVEVPTAAQRASQNAIWDSEGNLTAGLPASGTVNISAAMQPVVEAATLALSRDAYGLGNIATANAGNGFAIHNDDLDAAEPIVAVSGNVGVTIDQYGNHLVCSVAATLTLGDASTYYDGWQFKTMAQGGNVTIAIDASDAFSGANNGVSFIVPNGTQCKIITDGVATWYVEFLEVPTSATNFSIVASVATNNLTVALKDRSGNDPSTSSPVLLPFRDPTNSTGTPIYRTVTGPLSIVAAAGASLGFVNAQCGRLWLVAFDNGGTPVLALVNCLATNGRSIFPLGQYPIASSTQISAAATSAQVLYSQGAALASKPFIILGYISWEPGNELATAGQWSAAPSRIQSYTRDTPLPGQEIQAQINDTGIVDSRSVTTVPFDNSIPQLSETVQMLSQAIVPTSGANVLEFETQILASMSGGNKYIVASIFRDGGANALACATNFDSVANTVIPVFVNRRTKSGGIISSTFVVGCSSDAAGTFIMNGIGSGQLFGGVFNSYLKIKEIMA